jgi:hypothetical protein
VSIWGSETSGAGIASPLGFARPTRAVPAFAETGALAFGADFGLAPARFTTRFAARFPRGFFAVAGFRFAMAEELCVASLRGLLDEALREIP